MVYNTMDPVLVDIYSIKNIEFIKFYDLTLSGDDKQIIVPALLISYDNGKIMNLSIKDKFFETFVHKVIEVYEQEKEKRLTDNPFEVDRVSIDPYSKKILDNCDILTKNDITKFYINNDSYDRSLLYESDEIKSIIDIVRYEIKSFGEFANLNIELSDNIRGYRTNYILESKINDLFTYLLVHYDKVDDNKYVISIGNMGGVNKPFIMQINFNDNNINIISTFNDLLFDDNFIINNKNASYIKRVVRNEEVLKFETGNLEKEDPKEYNLIDMEFTERPITFYKLPWRAYYGYSGNTNQIEDNTTIYNNHVIYLDINDNDFHKRDFYTTKIQRDSTVSKYGIALTLDELRKVTFGFMRKPYYIIESSFKDARGNGIYQEKLNGRYFYHVIKAKNVKEIERERLIPVRKDIIIENTDFLSDIKLKKLGGKH